MRDLYSDGIEIEDLDELDDTELNDSFYKQKGGGVKRMAKSSGYFAMILGLVVIVLAVAGGVTAIIMSQGVLAPVFVAIVPVIISVIFPMLGGGVASGIIGYGMVSTVHSLDGPSGRRSRFPQDGGMLGFRRKGVTTKSEEEKPPAEEEEELIEPDKALDILYEHFVKNDTGSSCSS